MALMTPAAGDREGRTLALESSESLLLAFERESDACAFEELVRRHSAGVLATCRQVTGDAHDAEDAVQAVFLALALHARTRGAGDIENIGAWLQQVARNTSLNQCRSRRRRRAREEREAVDGASARRLEEPHPAHAAGMDELRAILRAEVDALPPKYRLPLILHYFGGMTPQEVAGQVKCTTQALAVRLFRARKMLGERLARRGLAVGGVTLSLAVAEVILTGLVQSLTPASSRAATAARATTRAKAEKPASGAGSASWIARVTRACTGAALASRLRMACFGLGALALVATALGQSLHGPYPLHLPREWDPRPLIDQAVGHARAAFHRLWYGPSVPAQPPATPPPAVTPSAAPAEPEASLPATFNTNSLSRPSGSFAAAGVGFATDVSGRVQKTPVAIDWLSSQALARERARTAEAASSAMTDGPVTLTGSVRSRWSRPANAEALRGPAAGGGRGKSGEVAAPQPVAVAVGPTEPSGWGSGGFASVPVCDAITGSESFVTSVFAVPPDAMEVPRGPHRWHVVPPPPPLPTGYTPRVTPFVPPSSGTPEPDGVAVVAGALMLLMKRRGGRSRKR